MTYAAEPTLRDVIGWCRDARLWIATGLLAGLVVAFLWVVFAVPQYRISMLVGPTTRTGTPDVSALLPENSSSALEYVLRSFGSGDSSDFMRFEAILRGPMVSATLLENTELTSGFSANRHWSFAPGQSFENAAELSAYLQKSVRIEPVANTPMRKVVYRHSDPEFGRRFLVALYGVTDSLIRQEMQQKAAARIVWLNETLRTTNDPEHRRMLAKLLTEQEQVKMILALNEPFSAMMAELPSVSARPVWPDKKLLFPLLGFIGGFLGFVLFASSGRARHSFELLSA